MREKMRGHLGGKKTDRFMLKQDAGGITDIEFLAQYLVLNTATKNRSLPVGATMSESLKACCRKVLWTSNKVWH